MYGIVTQSLAATHFKVSARTIRNWIGAGYIHGYQNDDGKICVSIEEIERGFHTHPSKMKDGRKKYGPKARIVPMPVRAEVVD